MPTTNPTLPLSAADVAVIDTETTGLDSRTARIVQIGGVRMHGAELLMAQRFDRLVNPGVPIPKATTAVHGISDADVAAAPGYSDIAGDFETFIAGAVLVGHTIGYDLAILERETKLAGRTWSPKRALDVKHLAELLKLPIAQHDLDRLAGALGVEVEGRHTALGDALTTARVFAALIPLLHERGIRTLAEAETATRELAARRAGSPAGPDPWPLATLPPGDPLAQLSRVDSFAYVHRVMDVMSTPPVWVGPDQPLAAAIGIMMERRISSLLVQFEDGEPGIVTERDMLRMINKRGETGLQALVREAATRPLLTIGSGDFVYRAIGRMERLGVRHLVATGSDGAVAGMVTARNLLKHRATTALVLGDAVDVAHDERALGRAWAMVPSAARALRSEGVGAREIANVISAEICAITRRAAAIAEQRMKTAGLGPAPARFAVMVLGSAGRGESLIAADQDNAIVFDQAANSADPAAGEVAADDAGGEPDRWLAEMAGHMAAILDAAGIPLCKGGVMAKNPQWRMSLPRFEAAIDSWVSRQRPEDILNIDIFFDGIPVSGDLAMGEGLFARAHVNAQRSITFQKMLAETARVWRAPTTILGGLRVERDGRIDLKKYGLLPIFTAARVLAIRHGERARSTAERLRAFTRHQPTEAERIERLIEAHEVILATILDQQIEDAAAGIPPTPRVELKRLTAGRRDELRDAISRVAIAIDLVAEGRVY